MSRVTDLTKKVITETALNMFIENSISKVRLYDIAAKADVGEATIYRHFGNKQNVVISAAIELSNRISVEYLSRDESLSGLESIRNFYNVFLTIFKNYNYYFSFLNELDTYLLAEEYNGRDNYQNNLNYYKEVFYKDYEKGLEDNSIKKIDDVEAFYFATTHSLTALCKKLSTKKILEQDDYVDKEKEIEVLIELFLDYLKK